MGSEMAMSERSGRRCARHGLAAGPDGWCALCRSESLPPPQRWSTRVMVAVLGGVLLTCGALLAWRALRDVSGGAVVAQPEEGVASLAPVAGSAHAAAPPTAAAIGESIPLQEPIPEPAAAALEPPPPSATAAALPTSTPQRPPPTPAELQSALRATPIVMYATSWCGACRRARQFLNENGLTYKEIDADTTPGGWDKVAQLTGERAVPVIVVDGEVSSGLRPKQLLQAVAKSMERRLGVSGIQFQPAAQKR